MLNSKVIFIKNFVPSAEVRVFIFIWCYLDVFLTQIWFFTDGWCVFITQSCWLLSCFSLLGYVFLHLITDVDYIINVYVLHILFSKSVSISALLLTLFVPNWHVMYLYRSSADGSKHNWKHNATWCYNTIFITRVKVRVYVSPWT
jgi:hypothetical protein